MKKLVSISIVLLAASLFAAPPILRNSATTNANVTLRTNLTSLDSGGNARGAAATDLQVDRAAATQVAAGNYSVLAGGRENRSGGTASVVGGGAGNINDGPYSFIGGGVRNETGGNYQIIVGGYSNRIDTAPEAFIGGGKFNAIENDADNSTLVAGESNTVGPWAHVFLGGGRYNFANGDGAVIAGGRSNTNSADLGFIGGGEFNTLGATGAIVPGGHANTVIGLNGFAVGSSNSVSGANSGAVGTSLTVASNNTVVVGVGTNVLFVGNSFSNGVPFQISAGAASTDQTFTNTTTRAWYLFTLSIAGDPDVPPSVVITIKATNLGATNNVSIWSVQAARSALANTLAVPVGPGERVWATTTDVAGTVSNVLRCQ